MTKCEECGHKFTNIFMRRACPKCGESLAKRAAYAADYYATTPYVGTKQDDSFDAVGFAVGMATGAPLSPTRGISTGSLIGAALHPSPVQATPDPTPSYSPPATDSGSSWSSSSSSSYDSGSSSSSSYDSGSSSSFSSDSGSSF